MTAQTPIISVRNLAVNYEDTLAIEGVSFDVYAGDYVAVIGPNGAGKSTVIKALVGLLNPRKGSDITIVGGRERLGYVPQHDMVDWRFPVNVRDVVMMGLTRQIGWLRWAGRAHHQRVDEALARVGLSALANRQIDELSGGQKQRVFMARALAQHADVLLLDEPFAGVDVAAQEELLQVIETLNSEGITVLLSTHDLGLAFARFRKVLALNHRLIAYGAPADIYTPQTLQALYGGKVAMWHEGERTLLFIDDGAHG